MKRWLLLDINGPLGQVTKIWLDAAKSANLRSEDAQNLKELVEIYRSREYARSPQAYRRITELVDRLMSNEQVREAFMENLRTHFEHYRDDIRETLSRFDTVILYSNMPHSVVRSVANVLRELTNKRIHAFGYHAALPAEYGKTKENFAFMLPWHKDAQVFHVTDEDLPLNSRFREYVYIGNVHSPPEMKEEILRRIPSLRRGY